MQSSNAIIDDACCLSPLLQHPLVLHGLVIVLLLSMAAGGDRGPTRQGGGAGKYLAVAVHQ